MIDDLVDVLTAAATDDSLRAIYHHGRRRGLLRGRGLGGHQQPAADAPAPATWSGASRTPRTG